MGGCGHRTPKRTSVLCRWIGRWKTVYRHMFRSRTVPATPSTSDESLLPLPLPESPSERSVSLTLHVIAMSSHALVCKHDHLKGSRAFCLPACTVVWTRVLSLDTWQFKLLIVVHLSCKWTCVSWSDICVWWQVTTNTSWNTKCCVVKAVDGCFTLYYLFQACSVCTCMPSYQHCMWVQRIKDRIVHTENVVHHGSRWT